MQNIILHKEPSALSRHKAKSRQNQLHLSIELGSKERQLSPEKARGLKEYAKRNLALLAKYFKKLYNYQNKTTFGNSSRTPGTRKLKIPQPVYERNAGMPKSGKGLKYHKEKMMMYKQGTRMRFSYLKNSSSTNQHWNRMIAMSLVIHLNICNNDNQVDQNAAECVDERDALANLIANLTLDTEENKTILKQLKKANASLTQELKECRTNLDETGRALGEATSCRDSCLIALQTTEMVYEEYKCL
ncbi:hypothetical protein Tco_0519504 [Tanacetum coccineum]